MYKNILVPLDGSERAECVLSHVDGFVTACRVDTIVFVRVVKPVSFLSIAKSIDPEAEPKEYEKMKKNIDIIEAKRKFFATRYLTEMVSRVKQSEIEYKTNVLVGKIAESIVDYADTHEIDLILIASHGRSGINRWMHGSIADRVLRSSSAPVLMVRPDGIISRGKA